MFFDDVEFWLKFAAALAGFLSGWLSKRAGERKKLAKADERVKFADKLARQKHFEELQKAVDELNAARDHFRSNFPSK